MDGVWHRRQRWSLWWLLLPIGLLVAQVSTIPYLEPDSTHYLSMASSLAENGVMLNMGNPHLMYAVGYPAVLSSVYLLPIDPILGSSLLNILLGMIYLLGVWCWCRRVAPSTAVWMTCLGMGNATVLYLYRRPLSEPLFMALLIWCSLCLDTLVRQLPQRINWKMLILSSVLMGMMVATRQAGIVVMAGLGTLLLLKLWQRSITWQRAFVVCGCTGVVAMSVLLGLILHDQQTKEFAPDRSNWDMMVRKSNFCADHHEDHLAGYLLEGVRLRVYEIGRLLAPGMFGCYANTGDWLNVNTFIYVPLAGLVFFGWWRLARRQHNTLIMMFPWYFALYVYWPADQGGRFFAPILPLLFLSLWKGLGVAPILKHTWCVRAQVIAHALAAVVVWWGLDYRNNIKVLEEWRQNEAVSQYLQPLRHHR